MSSRGSSDSLFSAVRLSKPAVTQRVSSMISILLGVLVLQAIEESRQKSIVYLASSWRENGLPHPFFLRVSVWSTVSNTKTTRLSSLASPLYHIKRKEFVASRLAASCRPPDKNIPPVCFTDALCFVFNVSSGLLRHFREYEIALSNWVYMQTWRQNTLRFYGHEQNLDGLPSYR